MLDSPQVPQETIDKLKEKYPGVDLSPVDTVLGPAVFRTPTSAEFNQFQDLVSKSKLAQAVGILARQCVVYPDPAEFSQWLEKKPGIPLACSDTLSKLAGATADHDLKKY